MIPVSEPPLLVAAFLPFVSTSLATTFDFLANTCSTERKNNSRLSLLLTPMGQISAVRLMERFIVKEVDINLNSELRCRTIEATSLWAVKHSIFKTFEQKLINYGKLYKPLLMNKPTEERSNPISRINTNFIVVCT